MIVFNLNCDKGHGFEGWFQNSTAFEEQSGTGKLLCPICDSRKIEKAPMAPAVKGAKKSGLSSSEEAKQARQFMTKLRKIVTENADYVGPKFAEEARKIHYGEAEDRHIYGEATLDEAKELVEEGVEVAPLPPDLNDQN